MMKQEIDDYLAARRSFGFDLGIHEYLLHGFERFASARGEVHIRKQTVVEWAAEAPSSRQQERRLRIVVHFARYARTENPAHEIPPVRVFGRMSVPSRYNAYILSPDDIRRIMMAATTLESTTLPERRAFFTLFGLLAATGMRVSEALALRLDDVTSDGLVIRQTKFQKSRLLPLHETTSSTLRRYLRGRRPGGTDDHVFLTEPGKPLQYGRVHSTFRKILAQLGLHQGPGHKGPRLHDLRHTFAVRALEACPMGARDPVDRHLLALSTYLGHLCPSLTYWYLQLTPQLTADIADACEAFFQEVQP